MRIIAVLTILLHAAAAAAADMEWVKVSDDNKGFVLSESGKPFIPWGFNYDHEGDGKLIEDYWDDQWPTVESAFREMKGLGANVVRIHLQFGPFMESPTEPRQSTLDQLARLVKLAEELGSSGADFWLLSRLDRCRSRLQLPSTSTPRGEKWMTPWRRSKALRRSANPWRSRKSFRSSAMPRNWADRRIAG